MKYFLAVLMLIALTGTGLAKMVSVATYSANIHNSPILRDYNIILRVPRYYPFSVREEKNDFFRVIDYLGRTGWVHKSVTDSTPAIVLKANNGNIRKGPGTHHQILFRAKKGVAFKVLDRKTDWISVEHESGQRGWIHESLTWGSR